MKPIVFGTSVQGASHIRSGTDCQDSCKMKVRDDGFVLMAVADGHGSKNCPYSQTGSNIAANGFIKILSKYADNYVGDMGSLITYLNREGDTKIARAIDEYWKSHVYEIHKKNKREMPMDQNGDIDKQKIYDLYGTTLLGLMLTEEFLFAYQIGDGDIVFVSDKGSVPVIQAEKILGVETHSLSKQDAWKKAITLVHRLDQQSNQPFLFMMSTDGFSNSYKNEAEFFKTCAEYFDMVKQHGPKVVGENLKNWLSETSEMGSGDDITVLIAYYCSDSDKQAEDTCIDEPVNLQKAEEDVDKEIKFEESDIVLPTNHEIEETSNE